MKLGKKPFQPDTRDAKFAWFRKPKLLPKRPKYFGEEARVTQDWGVLGNDVAGDCVFAGAAHEHMLWCAERGKQTSFTKDDVLNAYSAVTGYIDGDDSTDQGANVRDALKFRKETGIKDDQDEFHKIGAYVDLEPGNTDHLFEALYLFDVVGLGIEFPDYAMDQFNAGKPWKIEAGSIEGGHYVPLVAKRKSLICVTWAKLQPLTISFYKKYCDEAWGILSEDMLTGGKSPEGFDIVALKEYLDEVGGTVD